MKQPFQCYYGTFYEGGVSVNLLIINDLVLGGEGRNGFLNYLKKLHYSFGGLSKGSGLPVCDEHRHSLLPGLLLFSSQKLPFLG